MNRPRGRAHVNLNVTDVDRSARFYSEVLGMRIHSDNTETIEKDGRSVELRQVVLSAATQQVERLGGKVRSQGDREHDGQRESFAYVQDPDGYHVELSTQGIVLAGISNR
jgi:catechol 2,3-dioxygenase-like lactoylglutathione lyase family enzyme